MKKDLKHKKGILILDVPLLYESKMEKLADIVIVVSTPREKMIARGTQKGMSPSLSKKIIGTQWPLAKKVRRADYVIENKGNLKELEQKTRQIFEQIKLKINQ